MSVYDMMRGHYVLSLRYVIEKGVWVFVCEFVRIADISEG